MEPVEHDESSVDAGGATGTDDDVHGLLRQLHDHVTATAERPVETRVRQVPALLDNVDATGDADADDHLTAARHLVDSLEDRL